MKRALQLAQLGLGSVSPNPLVGCVIVHDGKIIGEGYHQKYGEAHAEVNAISSVDDHTLLSKSTAYVTLEPCSHFGKTPPCADLLVEKGIKKVVVSCEDPFVQVDGKGVDKLKKAGIEVEVGLLADEATKLNRRFFTFHQKKRPYVILKWAQTADGFIARENFDSKWISNRYSRQLVHKWRTEEDAILVGKNTAVHDNPALTAREWAGKNPTRVLLDGKLAVSNDLQLFDATAPTLIFNTILEKQEDSNQWIKLPTLDPKPVLNQLHSLNIQSVIIEGGAATLNSFIASGCWDEARIFTSSKTFGAGLSAPFVKGKLVSEEPIFDDRLTTITNPNG